MSEHSKTNVPKELSKMWWKTDWEGFEQYSFNFDWIALLSGNLGANELWDRFISATRR